VASFASPGYSFTLTPNFDTGFGPVTDPTFTTAPSPGSSATLGGGSIDFGNVATFNDYLYRFALKVGVTSPVPFTIFAEGTSDLVDGSGNSLPISSLVWLPTRRTGTGPDTNHPEYGGMPFVASASNGVGDAIDVASAGTYVLPYDFVLHVAEGSPGGFYSTQLNYTVVPQ